MFKKKKKKKCKQFINVKVLKNYNLLINIKKNT